MRRFNLSLAVLCFLITGCVGEATSPNTQSQPSDDGGFALIDGIPTQERTEIGKLLFGRGLCTATLIAPRVAITARHCVGYTTCDDNECASLYDPRVVFEQEDGRSALFRVVAFESYDEEGPVPENFLSERISYLNLFRDDYWTSDDVALLLLEKDVPQSVAIPTTLVDRDADLGEQFTIWGYGCTDRDTRQGSQTKRRYEFVEGNRSNNLCPGDSGGPVTLGHLGGVRYVNSAYATTPTAVRDVFGDVRFFDEHIARRLNQWGLGAPEPEPEPEFSQIGDACQSTAQCGLRQGVGMCADEPSLEQRFCTESCQGQCSTQSDDSFSFCVSFDGINGVCVPQPTRANRFCAAYDGFVTRVMTRFVGQSGATVEDRTVCVPPSREVEPPPAMLTPPSSLQPSGFVQTPDIDFTWQAVAGAQTYDVEIYYHDGAQWMLYHSVTTPATGLRLSPVLKESPFYFQVRSCRDMMCSSWSEIQSFYFGG